jgi:hypothetical protein
MSARYPCLSIEVITKILVRRLAGQLYDYTFKTRMNWSKERGQDPAKPDASAAMKPIETQILAVAAYLGELK